MLSDEERKEYIEHEILDRLYCLEENDFDKNKVDDGYIKAVLNACKEAKNLIEKQSKEIEELKAISEYREKIIKGLGLKTLPKTITGFRELIENNDKKWEDKIKAKIEEYENKIKKIRSKKIINEPEDTIIITRYAHYISVLQSLLEKE